MEHIFPSICSAYSINVPKPYKIDEKIAIETNVFPKMLIVGDNTDSWSGYKKVDCESVKGGEPQHFRYLFERE